MRLNFLPEVLKSAHPQPSEATMERLKRILVVDDQEMVATYVAKIFQKTGEFEARVVTEPTAAVAVALDFEPDVVILDVVMPGMDGGEVLAAMREQPALADVAALFLTGIVSDSEVGRDAQSGGVPLVAKPVRPDALKAVVAELLQGR